MTPNQDSPSDHSSSLFELYLLLDELVGAPCAAHLEAHMGAAASLAAAMDLDSPLSGLEAAAGSLSRALARFPPLLDRSAVVGDAPCLPAPSGTVLLGPFPAGRGPAPSVDVGLVEVEGGFAVRLSLVPAGEAPE